MLLCCYVVLLCCCAIVVLYVGCCVADIVVLRVVWCCSYIEIKDLKAWKRTLVCEGELASACYLLLVGVVVVVFLLRVLACSASALLRTQRVLRVS